jgi:hypothetical protein
MNSPRLAVTVFTLALSAGCAPSGAAELAQEDLSDEADHVKADGDVAVAVQALQVLDMPFTPHNTEINLAPLHYCSASFQHGNLWGVAYAKAVVSPDCAAIVKVVASKNGELVEASTGIFHNEDGWRQAQVNLANIVASEVTLMRNIDVRGRVTLRIPGV